MNMFGYAYWRLYHVTCKCLVWLNDDNLIGMLILSSSMHIYEFGLFDKFEY